MPIFYRLSKVPGKYQANAAWYFWLAMTRTILSQDSANWWQHAFSCEFASISTNANHYPSQSLTVAWLIFGSSSTPNLSLATGPVLSRDLFYAWASSEYRDSLSSVGFRLRRLSQIGIRLAWGLSSMVTNQYGETRDDKRPSSYELRMVQISEDSNCIVDSLK